MTYSPIYMRMREGKDKLIHKNFWCIFCITSSLKFYKRGKWKSLFFNSQHKPMTAVTPLNKKDLKQWKWVLILSSIEWPDQEGLLMETFHKWHNNDHINNAFINCDCCKYYSAMQIAVCHIYAAYLHIYITKPFET